ncbi:hypothetical protein [Bradyrhizobium sp. BR 10289]|uniref:hypothetical protein n=1 Tax=Bradyrhizobium sp. BR 10289 TaxID=2749993 RepID=UPI001C652422|nr:hypothetical protein [Bradyrhizobium sp. BR 10289]MBW7968141.1 hypothetical protein [Bradyrhizobium sp. BR 10289]
MSARTSLALRSLIAVAVLTAAGLVLIAGHAHDGRRAGVVRVQHAVSIATVRP